jgi:hypothetical protein
MTASDTMLAVQSRIVKFIAAGPAGDARRLLFRLREVDSLNFYVRRNKWLVTCSVLVILLTSLACLLGIFTLLPDLHWFFVLPLLVLLPIFLAGSLFVQTFVFFSWIEGRSLARVLGHRRKVRRGPVAKWLWRKLRLDMSPRPPIPWLLTAVFLFLPLGLLLHVWPLAASVVIALEFGVPIVYAYLDR